MGYAQGSLVVGDYLSRAGELGLGVAVPAVCLAEACGAVPYAEAQYFAVLRALPFVTVVPLEADECMFVGDLGRRAGRLGLGHAAVTILGNCAMLLTSQLDRARKFIPEGWPIEEV
jgi:hypothetical protein